MSTRKWLFVRNIITAKADVAVYFSWLPITLSENISIMLLWCQPGWFGRSYSCSLVLLALLSFSAPASAQADGHDLCKTAISVPYCHCDRKHHPLHLSHPPPEEPPVKVVAPCPPPPPVQNVVSPMRWDELLVKTLASSGFSLVSLAFAAFTFLYGALIGLRNDADLNPGNAFAQIKSKLALSIYCITGTIIAASAITILANMAIALNSRLCGLISIGIAGLLLLAIPSLVIFLAHDVYKRRTN